VQILLHALDRPGRVATLDKADSVPGLDCTGPQHAEVPSRAASLPGVGGKVLELEAVVELEARLAREADLEEDAVVFSSTVGVRGRRADRDDVAYAEVALVEVGGDEILAEGSWSKGGGRRGEIGAPRRVVGAAVCIKR
jgi:hypothetical protein